MPPARQRKSAEKVGDAKEIFITFDLGQFHVRPLKKESLSERLAQRCQSRGSVNVACNDVAR